MSEEGTPQTTGSEVERLAGLLSRADNELTSTLGRLQRLRQELTILAVARVQHPWSNDEFSQYLSLTADERRAHRHYLAIRTWHEVALRRLRQASRSSSGSPDAARASAALGETAGPSHEQAGRYGHEVRPIGRFVMHGES